MHDKGICDLCGDLLRGFMIRWLFEGKNGPRHVRTCGRCYSKRCLIGKRRG